MQSRVLVIRHSERDKANEKDPQALTDCGEVIAFVMGVFVRVFNFHFVDYVSSPQPRCWRTLIVLVRGICGYKPAIEPDIAHDPRLDDFSTDKRDIVSEGLKAAKAHAKTAEITVEAAIMETAPEAVDIKSSEMLEVIDERGAVEGDHLVTVHGAAIDGAAIKLSNRLGANLPMTMDAIEGQLQYCEGFLATFEDGKIVEIEILRLSEDWYGIAIP
ncbi:MAG: hypothetical protein RB292_02605 [Patescibacteria group bacterium]|jgi:broad specificity phosphatase PhoE|nr:hypothetical protein [Patescibacteria group bacterium]